MGSGDWADADAMAAATDEVRAKEREAIEKKAKRRVVMTAGDLVLLHNALKDAGAFADRYTNVKEHGVRTAAINIVARTKPLLAKLSAKIPEYVTNEEGS
jgi:hypothetical protein